MDDRQNATADELWEELTMLRRGQAVEGEAFLKADYLKYILGADRDTFRRNLNSAIERHVPDARWQKCLMIALNIDSARSDDNLGTRRRVIASMHEISVSTVMQWEKRGLWSLAQGIAAEQDLDQPAKTQRHVAALLDQLTHRIDAAENEIATAKQLIVQLKGLS
jgi:hypothetical protein